MHSPGRIVLDLPPGLDNPRNSEGSFIRLNDGRIRLIYSCFSAESAEDHAPADLAFIDSADQGETWTRPSLLFQAAIDQARNIMSVSCLRMQNGDLGLVYFTRYGFDQGKPYLRRSADEGKTWGPPVCCAPADGFYVINNDRVIRLSRGRLLVPVAFHRSLYGAQEQERLHDGRGVVVFFYSDDDGKTWSESNLGTLHARHTSKGLQEPGVVELKQGVLYGWARTDVGVQYEMMSHDSGATWSVPQPSIFSSPCSPLSMKRDPVRGNLVAVWNPIPEYITRPRPAGTWNGGRTPLVCAVSRDEGSSWQEPLVLEDEADRGYCYTAMHFLDDQLLLAYCAGGPEDGGCLNRLRIRKLPAPG